MISANIRWPVILLLALLVMLTLEVSNTAKAAPVTGSTSMVVVSAYYDVTESPEANTYRDDVLTRLYFTDHHIEWTWTSPWVAGPAGANALIWAFRTFNNGKTWRGRAWDFVGYATNGAKELEHGADNYFGTMFTTMCNNTNPRGCLVQNNLKERSNLMFKYKGVR